MLTPEQETARKREEARYACLAYLYDRAGLALSLNNIYAGIGREGYAFTQTELYVALKFLEDEKLVVISRAKLGSTEFFQITAEGQKTQERGR